MLKIGQTVPDFELPNQDGEMIKLSEYRGKNVVIFSFPKANSMGCTMQACAFRDAFPQIESANAVVFGISGDNQDDLAGWKAAKNLQYDLLSDPDHKVLDSWDAWGVDLKIIKLPIGATRSYWVIDANGVLIDQQIGVGPKDSLKKALKALETMPQSV